MQQFWGKKRRLKNTTQILFFKNDLKLAQMVGAFSQPEPCVSLFISVKHDRPKPNLPKRKGIHTFRCSVWVCYSANVFFRTAQCQDKTALFRAHCQQAPKTHYSSAEHRRPHCKQNERSSSPRYAV